MKFSITVKGCVNHAFISYYFVGKSFDKKYSWDEALDDYNLILDKYPAMQHDLKHPYSYKLTCGKKICKPVEYAKYINRSVELFIGETMYHLGYKQGVM